ncbi:uncharacterized protein LOC103571178 [Microplitis demolitor]|uniref:uncharacterized protein LOC103571178 n=1 Tax=Microplitis demolitor TaxID=69319 RepID=UPI0004CD074F|nr:uncharacterized protein LOC103571178 [Microplitis demolitor]
MHLLIACLIALMVISLSVHCRGRSGRYINEHSGDFSYGNSGFDTSNFRNFNRPWIWGSTEDGEIIIESLTYETLDGALNVIRTSFFTDENMSKGCGLLSEPGASEEVEQLILEIVKDGISIVAKDVITNEVVGTIFNKLFKPQTGNEISEIEIFRDNFKHKASKCFIDVYVDVESRVDLFKLYNANCTMEMTFLAVNRDYRRRGIAGLLVSSSLELGRQLYKGMPVKTPVNIDGKSITNADDIPSIASVTMTAKYSQKLLDKFAFDKVIEVSFNEVMFEGRSLSEKIGNTNQTAIIGVKSLSTN